VDFWELAGVELYAVGFLQWQ